MAQIRKFSNGGGSPEASTTQSSNKSPKKPYKLTIDGKTFELDDDDIYRWSQAQSSNLSAVGGQAFQDVINAIKRGTNVHYNSATNTFSGVNFSNKDIVDQLNANRTNPNQKQAARQLKRWAKRAYRKGDIRQDWMVDTAKFMKYNFAQPTQQTQESTDTPKTSLFGSYGNFQYETDDQGNISWSQSPLNASALRLLDEYQNLGTLSREDAFNRYNMDETKYNQFMDWYNTYGQNYDWNALTTRIQNKQFDPYDNELLGLLGWNINGNQEIQPKTTTRSYEGSGFNDDILEQSGYYVRKGDDGNTYLLTASTDSEGNVTYTPVSQNMYLVGNPLVQGTDWENGAVYNGRLYTNNDVMNNNVSELSSLRALFNQFRDAKDPESLRQIALNSGWSIYGMQNPLNINENNTFVSGQNYLEGFNNLFNDGTYYWTDISDKYNLPTDSRVLSVYNTDWRNPDNTFREQYAISHNGQSQIFDSIEKLQNYLNDHSLTRSDTYRTIDPLSQYRYIVNNGTRYFYMPTQYLIPGDESTAYNIYRDEQGNYYTDGVNGKFRRLEGQAILDKIKNGTVTAQELKNGYATEDASWWGKNFDGSNDGRIFGIRLNTKNENPYDPGSLDDYFQFYKNGGKIKAYQFGGLFSSGQVGNQKENKPVDSKVGQAQKLKADKKLKTGTDSANLAAGILDTTGLATSWIPGLGTAIGVLGSLARFSSDIQKDGFQWKDLGNLGINLGLDALTLLPGVGAVGKAAKTGVKAAKTAKAIKRVDKAAKILNRVQPILSTAGTVAGTSQIAGAIKDIQNDEFTSESMGNLLSGLGNTAMGVTGLGKVYRRAKVAKKLNESPIKDKFNIKEEDKSIKKTAKKVGNWANRQSTKMSGPFKTLRYMYSPGKVESTIASNWQTLARSSNSYANRLAAEYLNKIGRQNIGHTTYEGIRKGPIWIYNRYDLNKKIPKKVTTTSRHITAQVLNDLRKAKPGASKDIIQKYGTPAYYPDYETAISIRPEIQKMMTDILKQNKSSVWDLRQSFGENFLFKQGGKIIKAQNGDWTGYWGDPTKAFNQNIDTRPFPLRIPTSTTSSTSQPYTLVMNNTNTNPYFNYERGGIKFDTNGNVDWKATYDTNSDYMKYRKYYIDNWNKDSFKDIKQAYLNQLARKGRKSGTVPMDMSLDEFERLTYDKRLGYAHDLYTDAFANAYSATNPTAPQIDTNIELPAEELQVDASSPITGSTDIAPVDYVDNTGKIIPGSAWSGLRADKYTPKLQGWNPDDLIGGIELARSLAMNTAMFNNYKKANKLIQKEMPTEIYDRYQDHITPIFNEQARNKRQFFVPTSTDALTNYAMRQTNEDAARQLEMEGKLRASEAYSQYLDKDLAARRAYAEDRRNTAFFNRQEMANKLMRDAQIDMQRKLANNQSIQNAVMEFRNKLNQDWNRRQNFMQQEDAIKGAQAYDAAIKKYLADNGYNNQWNALSNEDKRTYGDIQNWLSQTNYSAWNDMMTNAGNARIDYMRGTYNNYLQYPWSRIRYAKKGTKTPTYLQRHTGQKPDEAIWIQRNKDTAKAIEKLHDAVIKLFMKSIS